MVFPLIAAHIHRTTLYTTEVLFSKVHRANFDLLNSFLLKVPEQFLMKKHVSETKTSIEVVKSRSRTLLGYLDVENLFTMRFHLLNYIFGNVLRFVDLSFCIAQVFVNNSFAS